MRLKEIPAILATLGSTLVVQHFDDVLSLMWHLTRCTHSNDECGGDSSLQRIPSTDSRLTNSAGIPSRPISSPLAIVLRVSSVSPRVGRSACDIALCRSVMLSMTVGSLITDVISSKVEKRRFLSHGY